MLLRRVILLAVFVLSVSLYDVATAKLSLSLTVGAMLIIQFLVRPFEESINNYLETFGLSLLLLLVAVNSQNVGAAQSGIISSVLLVGGATALLSPLFVSLGKRVVHVVRQRVQSASALLPQPDRPKGMELRETLLKHDAVDNDV